MGFGLTTLAVLASFVSLSCSREVKDKDCSASLFEPPGAASPRSDGTNARPDEAACRADCEQLKSLCAKGNKAAIRCVWDGREIISKSSVFDCR